MKVAKTRSNVALNECDNGYTSYSHWTYCVKLTMPYIRLGLLRGCQRMNIWSCLMLRLRITKTLYSNKLYTMKKNLKDVLRGFAIAAIALIPLGVSIIRSTFEYPVSYKWLIINTFLFIMIALVIINPPLNDKDSQE
jgi:hypothetical protein